MIAKVLVIEADPSFKYALTRAFIAAGYSVVEATQGIDALRLYQLEAPDVVLTDLLMPEIDGVELIHKFKKQNPRVVVVVISGKTSENYLKTAELLGAEKVLLKPINAFRVVESVRDLLCLRLNSSAGHQLSSTA